ncbi:MAG: hypothetical protein IT280_12305 [Ignavibacteria bacterium]|nr:hypothetical protein [Ignavibacteria bacterium]
MKTLLIIINYLAFCTNFSFAIENNKSFTSRLDTYKELIHSNFECEISLDKNIYYEGEAIWASIKIINTSNNIDSLPYSGADYLIAKNLIVKDENGNIYTYHGSSGVSLWVPYEHFLPNRDTVYHIELISDFGNKYENSYDNGAMISYFESGKYSLQLIHEKAGLVSELKSFTIYKPDEVEMQRLNLLRQIYGIKDRNERITEYYKFIENNAGSIFIPQTIYFLNYCFNVLYLSGKKIDNKLIVINNSFLESYPNSYFASEIIRTIWRYEFQQSGNVFNANKKLNEIIIKFPNTYTEIISKYWLNSKPSLYELEPKIKYK